MSKDDLHKRLVGFLREVHRPAEGPVPHDLWDFIHEFGNESDALLYAQLFCPFFVEVDGSVLNFRLGANTHADFIKAKQTWTKSVAELEMSFNVLEIEHAFSHIRSSTELPFALLAEFVAEAWRGRLALLYPERVFAVVVISPKISRDGHEVRFSEVRRPFAVRGSS